MCYGKICDPSHYWPGPPLWDMHPDPRSHRHCWLNVFWLDIRSRSLLIRLSISSIYHFISLSLLWLLPHVGPRAPRAHTGLEYLWCVLGGCSGDPIMGLDRRHGVPMDASVEGTQKPADEEVGGIITWGLLGEDRGACGADWGFWADTSLGLLGADERNVDHGDEQNRCFPARSPHVRVNICSLHTRRIVSVRVSS